MSEVNGKVVLGKKLFPCDSRVYWKDFDEIYHKQSCELELLKRFLRSNDKCQGRSDQRD